MRRFILLFCIATSLLFLNACSGDKEIEKLRKNKEEKEQRQNEQWERLQSLNGMYNGEVYNSTKCQVSIAIGKEGERVFADIVVNAIGHWSSSARAFLVSNSSDSAVFSADNGISVTCKYSSGILLVSSTRGWIFEGSKS